MAASAWRLAKLLLSAAALAVPALACRNECAPNVSPATAVAPDGGSHAAGAVHPVETVAASGSAPVPSAPPPSDPPRVWPPAPPADTSEFCIDGIHALDSQTCYVLPDAPTDELLIYLHGIVPPSRTSVQKTNFETVVARASQRANVAALMPRGEQGLAPKGHADWWGWPTSVQSYQRLAPQLLARFSDARRKLERLTGSPFRRVYVAGSSSGAYFTALLAADGQLVADGYGAMSGGSATPGADFQRVKPTKFYIGYGHHDTVGAGAESLARILRETGWNVRVATHPVGHGAKEVYLDEAFAFWRERASE